MMRAPCKDCPDRAAGCHGKCEKYQAFRAEIAKENAERDTSEVEMINYYRRRRSHRMHKESRKAK